MAPIMLIIITFIYQKTIYSGFLKVIPGMCGHRK